MNDHPIVGRGHRPLAGAEDAVLNPVRHLHDPLAPGVRREEFPAGREIGRRPLLHGRGKTRLVLGLGRLHLFAGQAWGSPVERIVHGGGERLRVDLRHPLPAEGGSDPVAEHVARALKGRLELEIVGRGRGLDARGEGEASGDRQHEPGGESGTRA